VFITYGYGGGRRLSIDVEPEPAVARIVSRRGAWSDGEFENSRQQDAHEAFGRLASACDGVDWHMLRALPLPEEVMTTLARNEGTNADRYSTPFWDALGGVQKSTVICNACHSTASLYEMWHSLSLSLPKTRCSIEELVSDFFKREPLSDPNDRCLHERCRTGNQRDKVDQAIRWPSVLILHLKRWEIISIWPFKQRKVQTQVLYETMFRVDVAQSAYHLRGVVQHHGDAGGGHYTSMVRAPDNFWYFCDDARSPQRVSTETALAAQAMILVYERT
jgi:hypothetical protein